MAANNNPPLPEWFFGDDPALSQKTRDGLKLLMQYVWALRGQAETTGNTVQGLNQNITQQINQVSQNLNVAITNAGNRVIFGSHFDRGVLSPAVYASYLYVETDRNQATYGSNGVSWNLIAGASQGSFETRYAGFNTQDAGFEWVETSRNNQTGLPPYPLYRWDGANWNFIRGEFYRNQSDLATLANTFAPANAANGNDVGARVNVMDFAGQLQWTNANNANAWAWGPDDCQMHGFGPFAVEVDPSPATAWQIYAGNANVTYLKSDGTTGAVNLPDLRSAGSVAFLEFGNNSSGNAVNPAVVPLLAMNSYTPTGNVSGGGVSSNSASAITSVSGAGVTSTSGTFVTDVGGGGGTFAGDPAVLTGNVSNNGQPASIVRRAWFRR